MARKPLGRGLSALLGGDSETAAAPAIDIPTGEIDIDLIQPNPEQPRTRFTDEALNELAQSITANGIIQPIVVRKKDDEYQIVAGERRWRAAQRAGLRRVPVVIREIPDDRLLEIALIENIQRQELNPIEEARAYRNLIDNIGLTQDELAERVGKDRSMISTSMRVLKLPDDILTLVEEGKMTAGHGRALLLTDDLAVQRQMARTILELGLSVRETERALKKRKHRANDAPKAVVTPKDANMRLAETKLMRTLGTNVKISPSGNKGAGKIEIEYYNADDLDRIYERLMKDADAGDV